MESNKLDSITPGGTHSGVNPPPLAALWAQILEAPINMSEEMSLSEEDRLLAGDSVPSKLTEEKKKKRTIPPEEQAVLQYKNNLRRAKYFIGKTEKMELDGEARKDFQQRSYEWALAIMAKEEDRTRKKLTYKEFLCPESSASKRDRSQDDFTPPPGKRILTDKERPSTSGVKSSNVQRAGKAARNTHSALSNAKKKTDLAASTPTTSKAMNEKKTRMQNKSEVKCIYKMPFSEIVKLSLRIALWILMLRT